MDDSLAQAEQLKQYFNDGDDDFRLVGIPQVMDTGLDTSSGSLGSTSHSEPVSEE